MPRRNAWLCASALASVLAGPVQAQGSDFPKMTDYVIKLRSMPQYQSNPRRMPDGDDRRRSSEVIINSIGGAASVPLMSRDTRLDLAGNVGDARYSDNPEIDHQPKQFAGALPWRAGRLFAGRVQYTYTDRLYQYLDRVWPDRDMVEREQWQAQFGMRVTEDLTLPSITVFQGRTRYDLPGNQVLYNNNEKGWEAALLLTGIGNDYLRAGFRQSRIDYGDRTEFWRLQIDDRYRDDQVFVSGQWDYSTKTTFEVQLGLLHRRYAYLRERDTRLFTLEARSAWQYSPKTRFDLYAWRRPYANDDSPNTLYSTLTGGRAAMRWQYSPKTAAWVSASYDKQDDTRVAGGEGRTDILRLGARLEWSTTDNVRMVLDGYRQREKGRGDNDSYSQNIVRLGLEFAMDNGSRNPRNLLFTPQCDYGYVEYLLC